MPDRPTGTYDLVYIGSGQ
ncbi:hypothetical protein A2U01_0118245, partial [Trifolium medium]|nr:hypothetical protein [Trifolium medium]